MPDPQAPQVPSSSQSVTTLNEPSALLSGPIKAWLLDEPDDDRAVAVISESPMLRSEATMALPMLRQAAMAPATREQIRQIVGKRFATYPQPERDDGEWMAWWEDYYTALEGIRADRIEAAMAEWTRSPEQFLPKGGQLRQLAEKPGAVNGSRWSKAYNRAFLATRQIPDEPDKPAMSKADKERIRREFADLVSTLKGKAAESISARTRNRRAA